MNSQLPPLQAPGPIRDPVAINGHAKLKPEPEVQVNILLVDDRPDKLLALSSILDTLGHNVVQAHSGKEALRELLKRDFAVILLDVAMPGMDGFETAALIRQRPRSEFTPIIFVTSIGIGDNYISRGYSLGAVDYLLTPIAPEVLRSKVSVFVELHKKTELIKQQAEQLRHLEEARYRRELAEAADRLEAETRRNRFFTLAVDLLAIADLEGRLLQTNPAWDRLLGYSPAELNGRLLTERMFPEDRTQFWEKLSQIKTSAKPVAFESRYLHQDGSCRWLRWTVAPFLSENLLYCFAADITTRKQAEDQVCRLNGELEKRIGLLIEANRELEAFNYSIAHDLRTPLRSMSGFAQALLEDESANLTPQGLNYAERITRSAKYMDSLLQDLLAYSRMARTQMALLPVDLEETVAELLTVLDKEMRDRRAHVEVVSPLGSVRAHLPTLKQVVANLIGNSLKFVSPGKCPAVRIRTSRHNGLVRLWIEDNGIGIAPEHQEKIFGLFARLHDSQIYPGTGIGLALVRKGAERMGGQAGVESQPGQGSRFWVDLPAVESTENEQSNPTR